MPDNNPTLESAVTAAVENANVETPTTTQETPSTEGNQPIPTTQSSETQATTETPATTQATTTAQTPAATTVDDETQKAINVYKLLNDPSTAPAIVKMLAEQLGITQSQVQQTQTKQPTVEDIIAAELGDDYKFMAPQLAKAINAAMRSQVVPLQEKLERTQAQNEFTTAMNKINETTKGDFDKHQQRISQLMDEIKPGQGVPVEKYLSRLYQIAKSETVQAPPNPVSAQKVVNRMAANAQEALPSPSAASESRVVKGPALPSLDEAIAAALKGERFQ